MKKFLFNILAAVLIAGSAQATLIDLTPGGFNSWNPEPPALIELFQQTFFDQAAHGWFGLPEGRTYLDGWVSRYGLINGGTFFFSDLFGHDVPSSAISWNMTGAPGGYWMTMIDVFGQTADGSQWENIYRVPWQDRFMLEDTVTLHDGVTINSIGFYGSNTIPDSGLHAVVTGIWTSSSRSREGKMSVTKVGDIVDFFKQMDKDLKEQEPADIEHYSFIQATKQPAPATAEKWTQEYADKLVGDIWNRSGIIEILKDAHNAAIAAEREKVRRLEGEWTTSKVSKLLDEGGWTGLADAINAALAAEREFHDIASKECIRLQKQLAAEREKVRLLEATNRELSEQPPLTKAEFDKVAEERAKPIREQLDAVAQIIDAADAALAKIKDGK